jgi:hypothetical protein
MSYRNGQKERGERLVHLLQHIVSTPKWHAQAKGVRSIAKTPIGMLEQPPVGST